MLYGRGHVVCVGVCASLPLYLACLVYGSSQWVLYMYILTLDYGELIFSVTNSITPH